MRGRRVCVVMVVVVVVILSLQFRLQRRRRLVVVARCGGFADGGELRCCLGDG